MSDIADAIRQVQTSMRAWSAPKVPSTATRLGRLDAFGTNPGALDCWFYAHAGETPMPLVVVLHGCTQTAASYDLGSGWSELAKRHGFAVLFPEQRRANNPNLCFNWFLAEDTMRGSGEVLSIRQMIEAVAARHMIDPTRVFVTGLSAGGAMANALLATYPETFAGGSIIAGLAFGAARSIPQALERMRGFGLTGGVAATDRVRAASGHTGPWPTISVWHGDADRTVDASNAEAILAQWRGVHGTSVEPVRDEVAARHRHRVWQDARGRTVVEDHRIAGMGHGVPIGTHGSDACGVVGPYMLEAGISSTMHQARSWELLDERIVTDDALESRPAVPLSPSAFHHPPDLAARPGAAAIDPGEIIDRALRAAGLMR